MTGFVIKLLKACPTTQSVCTLTFPALVWASFGSWLRTIRCGIPPSELVVTTALRQCLPQFLLCSSDSNTLAKFILEKQDTDQLEFCRLAG
jgi:hypothetical protein